MSQNARRQRLRRLFRNTRDLLEEMETSRQDLLSVVELNRALKQVLTNQAAILEALAAAPASPEVKVSPVEASRVDAVAGALDVAAAHRNGNGAVVVRAKAEAVESASDRESDASEPERDGPRAVQVLGEEREVDRGAAFLYVEAFDNRDQSFDRGLEKLNAWISGGGGTPYQWRGDRAYLNVSVASPAGLLAYEEQLMNRMGFSRRIGRLVVPGLVGEIVVYERP